MNPILAHLIGNWKSSVQGILTVGIALGTFFTLTPSNVLSQHTVAIITLATGAAKVVLAFFENDAKPAVTSSVTIETTAPVQSGPTPGTVGALLSKIDSTPATQKEPS